MSRRPILLIFVIMVAGIGFASLLTGCRDGQRASAQLAVSNPADADLSGFERATGPRELTFPRDFGSHEDYQTEWWYYTGNLSAEDGRRFGFELAIFRRALIPPSAQSERASDWAAEQIYFAHFALTDIDGEAFHAYERFSRGAAGLAGAQADPYQVWLEDWRVEAVGPDTYQLTAAADDIALDLTLTDVKGVILHGEDGYSIKGVEPGNASYYFSQPRLQTEGSIRLGDNTFDVAGLSWMDHEFSTSALSDGYVGWDWFSLQMDNGSELMLFWLRDEDGNIASFSHGTYIAPDSSTTSLVLDDYDIQITDMWRSPHSGAEYPAGWTITIPSLDIDLAIEPLLADQELNVWFVYWEGAVAVEGTQTDRPISGYGYVELTGYSHSMDGVF